MKKYNITVNGTTYEVIVEEADGVSAPVAYSAPAPTPVAAPAPTAASAPKAAPSAPKASASAGGAVGTTRWVNEGAFIGHSPHIGQLAGIQHRLYIFRLLQKFLLLQGIGQSRHHGCGTVLQMVRSCLGGVALPTAVGAVPVYMDIYKARADPHTGCIDDFRIRRDRQVCANRLNVACV